MLLAGSVPFMKFLYIFEQENTLLEEVEQMRKSALDVDDDSLLARCTRHSTFNSLELTNCDSDNVATLVVNILGLDHSDIVAVGGQGLDETVHGGIGDDKRRIVAIGAYGEVVVVIGYEGTNVGFLHKGVEGGSFGLGKN